jgi:hypothetical protein
LLSLLDFARRTIEKSARRPLPSSSSLQKGIAQQMELGSQRGDIAFQQILSFWTKRRATSADYHPR